jgi:hypothetical protein
MPGCFALAVLLPENNGQEHTPMQWIDEMFVGMEKQRAAASAKDIEKHAKVASADHPNKEGPGTATAWNALVSSITKDVAEFNNHKERAGQTPVRISQRHLQCDVHLPGMQGKSLVLTLNHKDLEVSIHPDFPKQPSTIAIELDKDGEHASWILGESNKENSKLSNQQLSEYLLKPLLSGAHITQP